MDPQAAYGHRLRYLCTRTRAHLQPRYLRSSSCRGFCSRPQRTGTNSLAGGVRPEPVGSSAWDDMSAQGSSVSIGSSESIAQGCAGAAKHRMCESGHRTSHKSSTVQYLANSSICGFDSPIGRAAIHSGGRCARAPAPPPRALLGSEGLHRPRMTSRRCSAASSPRIPKVRRSA